MPTVLPRRRVARLALCLLALAGTAAAPPGDDLLRIRLLDRHAPEAVEIKGEHGLLLYAEDATEPLHRLGPGEAVTIAVRGQELRLAFDGLKVNTSTLQVRPADAGALVLSVLRGTSPGLTRRYGGRLELAAEDGHLRLINHIDVETYVASVVAREYGFDDLEGSKAMAVIIRTYALRALGKFGDDYDHVDHTLSQVYDGLDAITPTALEATRQTAGEILTYRGTPIEAVYFASSGGHTADNETVWASPARPYLRGKRDPYDRSPHAQWHFEVPRSRLLDALSEAYGTRVEGFLIKDRSRDGRVRTVTLLGNPERTISGNDFRLVVLRRFGAKSLKSTLFDARLQNGTYRFEGRGFGHGVGLSQWGAHEMARQGHDYRDILAFYYTDVTLQRGADYAALLNRPAAPHDAAPLPPVPGTPTAEAHPEVSPPNLTPPGPAPARERPQEGPAVATRTGPTWTATARPRSERKKRRLGW